MSTIEYLRGSDKCVNPKAVSRLPSSVVRLTYYKGNEFFVEKHDMNGTIFSCIPDHGNAQFLSYILTSSDLFDTPEIPEREQKGVSPVSKIDVWLLTEELYEGEVMACDPSIRIAVIKIKSNELLPVAMLTPFTDFISVSPFGVSDSDAVFSLSPYPTKVFPGDELAIMYNSFVQTSHCVVVSGIYSVACMRYGLDSVPFLRINGPKIINGAPVINCEGDVIGVAFNVPGECVAFLPVNVFFKWWKHVSTYGEICRPWIGMSMTNLYTVDISFLERIVHDCDVHDGVLIDEVIHGSPAHAAGMRSYDVISQCDGRPVRSLLEFTELLWDKSGEVIEAKGVRDGCHYVWKVEIEAMKADIVPDWLVKSLAERNKSMKRGKKKAKVKKKSKNDKEKKRKRDV